MSKDTILIVDDERFFSNLLSNILQDTYQVIVADDSSKVLDLLAHQSIDLILLDIMIPDPDGYTICQQIKCSEHYAEIPVIFLTDKNEVEDEFKGLDLGAVDYIGKPICPAIVKARVTTHLALFKATKKIRQYAQNLECLVAERTVELTREIAEKQKIYEKLHYLANYDQLTLLPNRNLFNERLAYAYKLAKRNNSSFSLLLIDLDRFKQVNDSLGHHIGDLLLEQVGRRLSECLRGVDTIARLGGDEFTVTLTELQKKEDAAIVAQKIIDDLSRPFKIHDQVIHIGSSIGITSFPSDADNLEDMLKNADIAMYEVKNKGKNNYAFFSPEMILHASHRMELEKDLRTALQNHALYLEYQPIIELRTGKMVGVEALLRWKHFKHGQIPPSKIISIAEESDLILKLGQWIITKACKQLATWRQGGLVDLFLAINMSTRQFEGKQDCVELITTLLEDYQLPGHLIQLEITETLLLDDSKLVMDSFEQLKQQKVVLSIDDFGTGYSSLSYLRRFPIDILKIDQSFIRDFNLGSGDDTLVKAIIAMGNSLNLKIVAEGVEKQQQLDFLHAHQCDYVQGFYFSKPVAAEQIEQYKVI